MSNTETAILLKNCIPLLERARLKKIELPLTKRERVALEGYRQVFESGLTENTQVRQEVGFSSSDLAELSFLMLSNLKF